MKTILIIFFSFLLSNITVAKELDKIVAVIDDDVILLSELQNYILKSGDNNKINDITYQQQILDTLILKKLTTIFLQKNNLGANEQIIDAAIQQIAKNNKMNVATLLQRLSSQNISISDLRVKIKNDIEQAQLRQLLMRNNNTINQSELQLTINTLSPKTDRIPNTYSVGYILVNDQQLAKQILKKLSNGDKFNDLARKYSNAPSALLGGILNDKKLTELPKPVQTKIKTMALDQVTMIDDDGWHIIKLLKITGNSYNDEDLKSQASQIILQHRLDRYLNKLLQKLRHESYIEIRL